MTKKLEFEYGYINIENIRYKNKMVSFLSGEICLIENPDVSEIYETISDFLEQMNVFSNKLDFYIDLLLDESGANKNCVEFMINFNEYKSKYESYIDYIEPFGGENIEFWLKKMFEKEFNLELYGQEFEDKKYYTLIYKLWKVLNNYISEKNRFFFTAMQVIQNYIKEINNLLNI